MYAAIHQHGHIKHNAGTPRYVAGVENLGLHSKLVNHYILSSAENSRVHFLLLITHGCGALASWAVCLDLD